MPLRKPRMPKAKRAITRLIAAPEHPLSRPRPAPAISHSSAGPKQLLLWLLLLLTPLLFFPGVLTGRSVGADDHRSVHHAFQEQPGGHLENPALSDSVMQFQGLTQEVVRQLKAGRAPLWNAQIYGGVPLLADAQSRVASPWTWLHVLLPMRWAQTAGALLMLAALGSGTFLLSRRLGMGPLPALGVGLWVQATPTMHVWLLHPHATTFVWLPWLLLAVERARTGRALPLALVVAAILCGGHPETSAHLLLAGAAFWAMRGPTLRSVGAVLLGGLLSAPIWLPFVDNAMGSVTMESHGGNRLLLSQLRDLLWPNLQGHPAWEATLAPGVWADGVLNPGVGVMALALLGLATPLGKRLWLMWAVCVTIALLPVPLLNSARLGTHGAWLLALAAGAGLSWCMNKGLRGPALALVMALALGSGVHARFWDQSTQGPTPQSAPWTQELVALQGQGRVVGLEWALQPNTGMLVGLRDLRGYDLPLSRQTETFMAALDPALRRPWFSIASVNARNRALMEFAAVRYVLAPEPQFGLAPVALEHPTPLQIYALDPSAPRAWLASGARLADNERQSLDFVRTGYAGRGGPPVEHLQARLPQQGEALPVRLQDLDSQVLVTVDPGPAGVLVLADAWDPDWQVWVDGEPAELLRVGGLFRGVELPAGARAVRFSYSPWSWRWGLGFGAAGLLGLVALWRTQSIQGTP